MALPKQATSLLLAARHLVAALPADAILLLPDNDLDWDQVVEQLGDGTLLVASQNPAVCDKARQNPRLVVVDIDPGPTPMQERMSLALLEAVRTERLAPGADVVVLYNGINIGANIDAEEMDSVSVIHLGEHLERLHPRELRKLDTQVPLETLRAVVDLATEIGQEGREGKPVGTMFIVGDTHRVLNMARPMNFNPFRGYGREERDVRDPAVREQIKDIAQLEGAIIIRRDGIATHACMHITADNQDITLSMGLGTRHAAAAAISKATKAVAIVVSQSSGAVRIFLGGEVVHTIVPHARPMVWGNFHLETDANGQKQPGPSGGRTPRPAPGKERTR
jgi:DNA integrity scanning protein DisA with diadenylate cyclase activity